MNTQYKIHMLSARSLISYAKEENNQYTFHLSKPDTRKCIMREAADEQDDNALFYQTMCVLHGSNIEPPQSETALPDLQDVIFYVDFNGIFDRGNSPKMMERQKKAEAMFRPEGVTLDFGNGAQRYLAFERSGSMSRQAKLSFIRADVHDEVRRRIMMDMVVGDCQLSKLYAYNGLMLSGGVRIDGIDLTNPHGVIVVKNETNRAQSKVVSVEGTTVSEAVKKYNRKEELRDITVLRHDGEGLISKELAKTVDSIYCGKHIHHSFQIRMPYVKGMVHKVDFKDFLKSAGSEYITDIWGVRHPVDKVKMILTQSMFKGYGWLTENGMDWNDYLSIFKKYNHALYVTNFSKVKPDDHTELNYQFLNTLSMTAEEFRPHDLPNGWEQSPSTDNRNWITKATEQRYYDFCLNEDFRRRYFINKNNALGKCIKKNPLLNFMGLNKIEFFNSEFSMVMIIIIYIWKYCGFCVILFTAGLANVNHSLYESARLDGANGFQLVTRITIPLITPTTFFVFLMEIIYSFKIFREVFALFGEYPNKNVYFLQNFINNNYYNLNYPRLSSASIIMSVMIIALMLIFFMFERRYSYSE